MSNIGGALFSRTDKKQFDGIGFPPGDTYRIRDKKFKKFNTVL